MILSALLPPGSVQTDDPSASDGAELQIEYKDENDES